MPHILFRPSTKTNPVLRLVFCIFFISLFFNVEAQLRNARAATVSVGFTAPDTICVNSPVSITNNATGESTDYWSFCSANLSTTTPTGTNLGNIGGTFSTPVFID